MNLQWSPSGRLGVLAVCYTLVLIGVHILAYLLRFDFAIPPEQYQWAFRELWWVIPLKLVFLLIFGQFAGLVSYFSIPDLRRLIFATSAGSFVLLAVRYSSVSFYAAPRGAILLDFILSAVGLAILRLGFRMIRERYLAPQSRPSGRTRHVWIVGAGGMSVQAWRGSSCRSAGFA